MNILYVSPFSHGVNISPILNIAHLIANEGHKVHFYTVKTSYIEFKGDKSLEMAELPNNVKMHYIKNHFNDHINLIRVKPNKIQKSNLQYSLILSLKHN